MGLTRFTGYFLSLDGSHLPFPEFCLFLHPLAKWSELSHRKQWSQFASLVIWHFAHVFLQPAWSSLWLVSCSLPFTCWFVRVSLSSASSACTVFMAVTSSPCLGTFFSFTGWSCFDWLLPINCSKLHSLDIVDISLSCLTCFTKFLLSLCFSRYNQVHLFN